MDGQHFDLLTRRIAGASSRRTLIAGIAGAVLAGRFAQASAQTSGTCDSDEDCGLCEFCQSPGASGTCQFVPFQQDPNNDCPDDNFCSGTGSCSCFAPLFACTVNESCCGGECINGHCCISLGLGSTVPSYCCSGIVADNVCCNSACEGECNSCGTAGGDGICRDVNSNCSDGNNCTDDICTAGTCSSSPKDCSGLNELCKSGVCDAQTGNCIAVNNDNGFVCGTNAVCSSGQCVCSAGFVPCAGLCVAGECCVASDCDMESVEDPVCASMICINQMCELVVGEEACGPCQECDQETLDCVDACSGNQCCCDDDVTCSAACCPDLCSHDKDCPDGHCCCKDGSCHATCCEDTAATTPPPSTHAPSDGGSAVSTLPGTGTGSTAGSRGALTGLLAASGIAAWVASRLRSGIQDDSSQ